MFQKETVFALIVAAGRSRRMQGRDKLFSPLAGVPLLARTVEAFLHSPLVDEIVVILRPENLAAGHRLSTEQGWPQQVRFGRGGARRQDSVRLGLEQINGEGWVLIHDGARPLIRPTLIRQGLEAAQTYGAAVPGLPLADTVKQVSDGGTVERTLPRDRLRAVQTPQVFRLALIRAAHNQFTQADLDFTDDAALLEALGQTVVVFPGDRDNIKVTRETDLQRIEQIWKQLQETDGGHQRAE